MMRLKQIFGHPLIISILVIAVFYMMIAFTIQPPVPKSLLIQYMVIFVIGVFLVVSFNDKNWQRTHAPILFLLGHPRLSAARLIVFVIIIVGTSGLTYQMIKPGTEAPIELRTVHPAPPSKIKVYDKSYNLLKLENPLRKKAAKGSPEFKDMVKQGGEVYYKNCVFCHSDMLDGQGLFADGLNPRPANFQDVGTIAQLQESYLFWRISTGGPGLPREGTPWASAMPVWGEILSEEEIWQVILFLYDYTGFVPRSWQLEAKQAIDTEEKKVVATKNTLSQTNEIGEQKITKIYNNRCAQCHGVDGDGDGLAAKFLYPKPRDFTLAVFKYKTTQADDEFPTDDDLRNTIRDGLPGTSMPGWKTILKDEEIDGLIKKIKQFGEWDEEELELTAINQGTVIASSPASIQRGKKVFTKACVQCHGNEGRGNITSGKRLKDDWQNRIWPRNLTRPETWRATKTAEDVFNRVSGGIRGTPMPEHTTTMKTNDRWDVANYVMALRNNAVQWVKGETVIRGLRVEGVLPSDSLNAMWDKAPAITFPFIPNIIKEPRLYNSLNDTVTVRALFNDQDIAFRLDVDDRTKSVPGSKLEKQYRLKDVPATPDAVAIQFPVTIPKTSEKPWFRHGDRKLPVNMWYWKAPSMDPALPSVVAILDATGPDKPPVPRAQQGDLKATGKWQDGKWSVVVKRSLKTKNIADLQFQKGRYIPIAFANWDGINGEKGSRHSFTTWYWLLLQPEENPVALYGTSGGTGLLVGLLFAFASRRQRRHYIDTSIDT